MRPHDYADQHAGRFLEELQDLMRIPSISTLPQHAADVERAAHWLQANMERVGLDSAEVILMPGARCPLVLGTWMQAGPDAPTLLIYGHYDVQPAELEDGWETDPFTPTLSEGVLYGRGAVDSKLHVIAQLKAIESLLATEKPAINLKVIFEGEEESGSENIEAFIAAHGEGLRADFCVINDGTIIALEQPTLIYSLRGIAAFELHVHGPQKDLHSGHFGGNVHNPIQALAEILAQLHDAKGHITVPGFYDEVRPLAEDERAALKAALPYAEREWQAVAAAPQVYGEPAFTLHERSGARPTLEINGIKGGYSGDGLKTVLPARAMAKISCRLVPDQRPEHIERVLREHIERLTPPTVTSQLVRLEPGAPAVLIDRASAAFQASREAYTRGWGVEPILERAGGSVPITYQMQKVADQVVTMGFGLKSGRAHGPNENIPVACLERGVATAMHFIQILAQGPRQDAERSA